MRNVGRKAIAFAIAALCLAVPMPSAAQELNKEANDKAAAEARAKRNAQTFELNASTIIFYDRTGSRVGGPIGERAMYGAAVISPDGSRVAVVKADLPNESADVFILDIKSGAATRITTSARTEFVQGPIWSPDGGKIAYVAMRKGQEGIYMQPSSGGAEELIWRNTGAFINLSDWSSDGKMLTFTFSDMKSGTLYTLPIDGPPDRKATELFKIEQQQLFGSHFSPDGRFIAYTLVDKTNKGEIFVRLVDPAATGGPWQISDGSVGQPFWRRDGKEIYFLARDRSVMVVDVATAPSFSFTNRRVLFKPQGAVPEIVRTVSADGERFLVVPPPRGPQLQQLTIFDRTGKELQKIGEPGSYSAPSFSPDGTRLLVLKNDVQRAQADYWTIDIATGKQTQISNDSFGKASQVWSPDGTYIYYSSFRNGDFPVYRRRADGTGSEEFIFQYTPGATLLVTDVTADGKWLVLDAGGYVITVPLAGDAKSRKAVETLRDEFFNGLGRISPDGNFIAYRSDEAQPERGEIYVRPFKGTSAEPGDGKWRLSKDGVVAMLHWRGDGKEVFWRGLNLESNDFWVVSVDVQTTPAFTVGTPKVLFKLPGPLGGNIGNISRDGQRFVFAVNVSAPPTTVR